MVAIAALAGCGAAQPRRDTRFDLPSLTRATAAGRAVGGLTCRAPREPVGWAHVELFEHGRVVLLPAGVGIAPPRRRDGAYVRGGRCRYPLWTDEPTGLVALGRRGLRLGDLFRLWGRPLAAGALVHVGGVRHSAAPGAVALADHAQIVVQIGTPRVAPHAEYAFPPGR